MNKQEIISSFRGYRCMKSRLAYLEREATSLSEEIEAMMRTAMIDSINISARITGMPHSGDLSSPVESIVANLADGVYPARIRQMQEQLEQIKREKRKIQERVAITEIMIGYLNERQLFIVQKTFIDNLSWKETLHLFNKQYSEYYSAEGIKRIRDKAIDELCRVVS